MEKQQYKMRNMFFLLGFIALVSLSCERPTEAETRAINHLNSEFDKYEFRASSEPLGIYLDVKILTSSWDSIGLRSLYDSSVQKYKGNNGISWTYLSVHDQTNKYLFTISKDHSNGTHSFFLK